MFINVKGRLIDLSHPRVMGIINVTSDSFYEGSRFMSDNQVIEVAGEMLGEGADILDIGGCSTRPGTLPVTEEEEMKRVCRAVDLIRNRYPEAVISVDTYRASVAGAAVRDAGADIINDISGGEMDADMFPLVTGLECAIHYDAHAGYTSEYAG